MIISSIYRCEYCGKEYLTRAECELCEASHGHDITLHKKLDKILHKNNIFYKYQKDYHTLYVYKVTKIYNDTIQRVPECNLIVEVFEIRLNSIFDWYHTRVNDSYEAKYFIEDVETASWKVLERKDDCVPYTEISKIIDTKEIIESNLRKDPVISKYNVIESLEGIPATEIFARLFDSGRTELDTSLKEVKKMLKSDSTESASKIAKFSKSKSKKGK